MADGIYWQLAAGNADRLAQLPQQFYQGRQLRQQQDVLNARQEAGQLFSQGDNRSALARLAGVGDFQGVGVLNQIDQQGLPAGFRRTAAGLEPITGGPADPRYQQQVKLATAEVKPPEYREIEGPNGKQLVRIDAQRNKVDAVNVPGMQTQPNNPYAPGGKVTDEQAKAGLYGTRMAQSHKIITDLENINERPLGYTEAAIQNIPGANLFLSADRQKVNQAQRDFINAILRRESGAVIGESEFANARQQYFPQPGDSDEVIKQKRMNRITATQGIMAAAGQNYQPPADFARNNPNPNRTQQNVQQQQPQVSEGAIIVNPQTGERRQLRGGQWLPVQ